MGSEKDRVLQTSMAKLEKMNDKKNNNDFKNSGKNGAKIFYR